jgi:hypothetical protein
MPLPLGCLLEFSKSLLLFLSLSLISVSLHPFHHLQVLQVFFVSIQSPCENIWFSAILGQNLHTRIPTDGVHSFRVDSAQEWLGTLRVGSLLESEFVRSVAEHDSFVIADRGFGEGVDGRRCERLGLSHV